MKGEKNILRTENTTSKNYAYTKNNCRLAFSLRTDIKGEMKDFLELLEAAIIEVTNDLKAR